MKKFFPVLILLIILTGFLTPLLTLAAQEKIPACCKLSRDVSFDEANYEEGIWVGGTDCEEAVITNNCSATGTISTNCATKKWGLICSLSTIKVIIDWIFNFLMVFVGIMVILGAFNIVTSAGDPQRTKKGRDYILYAAIGMLVGLLAKAIPALLESLFGI